jgi:hypothetical protein
MEAGDGPHNAAGVLEDKEKGVEHSFTELTALRTCGGSSRTVKEAPRNSTTSGSRACPGGVTSGRSQRSNTTQDGELQ